MATAFLDFGGASPRGWATLLTDFQISKTACGSDARSQKRRQPLAAYRSVKAAKPRGRDHLKVDDIARRVRADYALRIDMTKPKPNDQLQKRGRKSDFRPEHVLIAKACARFGAIEEEIADELHINHATLDNRKKKYPEFLGALKAGKDAFDDRVERFSHQIATGWNGQPPNATAAYILAE